MSTAPTDLTKDFTDIYFPKKALLFYEHQIRKTDVYIESFDCNEKGRLINAHPLSEKELNAFAKIFHSRNEERERYLHCENLLPPQLLYHNIVHKCAIWYSPPEKRTLLFSDSLGIANGEMCIPSLIWKATPTDLYLYAIKLKERANANTILYRAPFFNMYDNGKVCMGTVEVDMRKCADLHEFIDNWQEYFYNSKFSHVIGSHHTTRSPIEQLYKSLLSGNKSFPVNELIKTQL